MPSAESVHGHSFAWIYHTIRKNSCTVIIVDTPPGPALIFGRRIAFQRNNGFQWPTDLISQYDGFFLPYYKTEYNFRCMMPAPSENSFMLYQQVGIFFRKADILYRAAYFKMERCCTFYTLNKINLLETLQ